MAVFVFLSRSQGANHRPVTETALFSRAVTLLPSVEDNFLDSLNIDLRNQLEERYALLTGETFKFDSRCSRNLEAQLPMPEKRLQRARYALLIDSTFLKNNPVDNVLSDVMVMTKPLTQIPEMAEVLVTMFDLQMKVTHRDPPPKRVVISNVLDHLACEGLMTRLSKIQTNETQLR